MSAGTAYGKRYPGGFVDLPSQTTKVDSVFLDAVETALLQLIGVAPTVDGQVAQWDFANTRFGPALLLNKNIDPAAAIDKSKLNLAGQIFNADIAGAAGIARSKLNFGAGLTDADISAAAAIASSKIAGLYPGPVLYRKTTAKAVTNTVAETDLLNAEITLGAGVLGTTGLMRLTAWGDSVYTAGAAQAPPRFKFKVGSVPTVVLDTNTTVAQFNTSATRYAWRIVIEWMNLGATNSQWATFDARVTASISAATSATFATGEGSYNVAANGVGGVALLIGGGASAIDTTAAQAIILSVINGSGTNTETKLLGAVVEIV